MVVLIVNYNMFYATWCIISMCLKLITNVLKMKQMIVMQHLYLMTFSIIAL